MKNYKQKITRVTEILNSFQNHLCNFFCSLQIKQNCCVYTLSSTCRNGRNAGFCKFQSLGTDWTNYPQPRVVKNQCYANSDYNVALTFLILSKSCYKVLWRSLLYYFLYLSFLWANKCMKIIKETSLFPQNY